MRFEGKELGSHVVVETGVENADLDTLAIMALLVQFLNTGHEMNGSTIGGTEFWVARIGERMNLGGAIMHDGQGIANRLRGGK